MRNAEAGLVKELRREIMDMLICGAVEVESKDLGNKVWWLKRGEKRHAFFVLEVSGEKRGCWG
jgi:hypothetical protein